jgi:hypothetical protein
MRLSKVPGTFLCFSVLEGERLPPPAEILASIAEREREILSIVQELGLLLGNNDDARE